MSTDLEALPVGDDTPEVVNAVIEVPMGSRHKYEYDPALGLIVRDRVLPGSVRYPVDYGFVPSTRAADGDALDVLLVAYDPAFPGCLVRARPVGVMNLEDSSGPDRNLVAVPDDDPRCADMQQLDDLPAENLRDIERFFEVYKRLEGDDQVQLHGWGGVADAHDLIRSTMTASSS